MDSDQGKLFIGGISWETSEDRLKEYFGQYGDILQTVVMRDKVTGRPRGFGFVVFSDPSVLDTVLQEKHTIDGRTVEAKRALSREEQQTPVRSGNFNQGRNSGGGGNIRTKKIFVGGLPPTLTEDGFRQYFEAYGHVTDVVIMYDQNTQRPRGFGFISFDTEDAVDRVLHKSFHDLNGKQVEVKRALPKDANPGGVSRTMSGGASGFGGYQGYGSSGGNSSSYDGRMDSNSYMRAQAYGNPNAGYASGPPGAPRSSWGTQAPSGYGAMGYGNAAPWGAGAGSGGPGSAATGQSPTGATGYGGQGYGYGGYGGNDGSYGNAGYGAAGGRSGGTPNSNAGAGVEDLQGSGGGYMGSGYGDVNGSSGYGNATWRSDSSQGSGNYGGAQANGPHGGQGGYGGGYGGVQGRQAQQQRRDAREFKGGVKCPLMAEPELFGGVLSQHYKFLAFEVKRFPDLHPGFCGVFIQDGVGLVMQTAWDNGTKGSNVASH
ncbi:hypothetical protein GOBAR_AA28690 [Gossypium barbadense]|uniref:RRM domain-containing protein n=1 Tax=Gossypium barbadense TaxID=3634 RepID=A0A2P5WLN5_GOSBA|nr:hypothetical protein GOBAR_AA28690 [Gossypium barbadense]